MEKKLSHARLTARKSRRTSRICGVGWNTFMPSLWSPNWPASKRSSDAWISSLNSSKLCGRTTSCAKNASRRNSLKKRNGPTKSWIRIFLKRRLTNLSKITQRWFSWFWPCSIGCVWAARSSSSSTKSAVEPTLLLSSTFATWCSPSSAGPFKRKATLRKTLPMSWTSTTPRCPP